MRDYIMQEYEPKVEIAYTSLRDLATTLLADANRTLSSLQYHRKIPPICCGDAKGVSKNNSDTLKDKGVLIEEGGGRVRGGGGEVGEKLLWRSIQPARI